MQRNIDNGKRTTYSICIFRNLAELHGTLTTMMGGLWLFTWYGDRAVNPAVNNPCTTDFTTINHRQRHFCCAKIRIIRAVILKATSSTNSIKVSLRHALFFNCNL
jgi:hypothetical protein